MQAEELKADTTRAQLALPNVYEAEAPRAITEDEKNFDAFLTLRRVRADKRNAGQRKKRADAVSRAVCPSTTLALAHLTLLSLCRGFAEGRRGGCLQEVDLDSCGKGSDRGETGHNCVMDLVQRAFQYMMFTSPSPSLEVIVQHGLPNAPVSYCSKRKET